MRTSTILATLTLLSSALAAPSGFGSKGKRAVARRDWTNMHVTTSGPTGTSNQTFEMTIDDGKTWTNDARSMPLGPGASVGFRLTDDNGTAVIHKNANPTSHWATYTRGEDPYNFGLWNNDIWVFTDFSQPVETSVSGAWVPMPMNANVQVENDGQCELDNYSATVYYKAGSGLAPQTIESTDPMEFDIDDVLSLDNITFSFGAILTAGVANPIMMWYEDASKGPRSTAHMQIYGGFCDVDD